MNHTGISSNGFLGEGGSLIRFTSFFLGYHRIEPMSSDDESGVLTMGP